MSREAPVTPPSCDDVVLRLVEGVRPTDDPGLAEHVRSCLGCFRVAGELRDLPRIETLLRAGEEAELVDPGPAFFAAFPTRVAAAWESQRQAADLGPAARVWAKLVALLRQPVPAAALGATCAALLVAGVIGTGMSLREREERSSRELTRTLEQGWLEGDTDTLLGPAVPEGTFVRSASFVNRPDPQPTVGQATIGIDDDDLVGPFSPRGVTTAEAIEQLPPEALDDVVRALATVAPADRGGIEP